jgi:ketosteroid isomerase-like protein
MSRPLPTGLRSAPVYVMTNKMKRALFLIGSLAIWACTARSAEQSSTTGAPDLTETISRMDAKLFDAFNAHDVTDLMSMFTDDVEFYQDDDGVSNYERTKNDLTKMLASTPELRRELVKGSIEVHPIKDYGAIEIGVHRFCHKENGKEECGAFKFVHIWRKTGDSWKIARVVSYGHDLK